MVSAGYDGLLPCGSLGLTLLVACAPLSAPADCAAYNRPHRVVPARLGLHANSIRRSFRPARASVPPAGQAFSRKTPDAASPHGAKVVAVQPRTPSPRVAVDGRSLEQDSQAGRGHVPSQ